MGDTTVSESHPDSKATTAERPTTEHEESAQDAAQWKAAAAKPADGDTAMALFSDPTALQEDVDPVEVRKLIWKIDFMILPYLAVCYAFFYIDKVCYLPFFFWNWLTWVNWLMAVDNPELCSYLWDCRGSQPSRYTI